MIREFLEAQVVFQNLEEDLKKQTMKAIQKAGHEIRDDIRSRIPPGGSTAFAGYAATGALKRAIQTDKVKVVEGSHFEIQVGLGKVGVSNKTRMVFMVHEFGKRIVAKNGKYLVFKVQGHWVQVREVNIREKRFFRDSWQAAEQKFPQFVYANILPRWRK